MCVTSAVSDYFKDQLPNRHPWVQPTYRAGAGGGLGMMISPPTRQEFQALQKEVQELRVLIMAAKKYDEQTAQPNCELEEKITLIKEIAKMVGVDMTGVILGDSSK